MPVFLLYVNLLFALAWEDHIHHGAAHIWFNFRSSNGWATYPMTQCGFVRLSCNPRVSQIPATPISAIGLLSKILSYPDHSFRPDDAGVTDVPGPNRLKIRGHQQVTDAYLIGLAEYHDGKLATFDKAAASLSPISVEIIDPIRGSL